MSPLIMLAGPSGTGKTKSSLLLATQLSTPSGRVFVIDTENGRAKLYADEHKFFHYNLETPFRPIDLENALLAAQKQGAGCIIVDTASHEHYGMLEYKDEETQRLSRGDPARAEAVSMLAWVKPKMEHKHMLRTAYNLNVPVIFCCQAERKIAMVKQTEGKDRGKVVPIDIGFQPVCGDDVPYAMTIALMLEDVSRPGVPRAIKALLPGLESIIRTDRPIDAETGVKLAAWACGEKPDAPAKEVEKTDTVADPVPPPEPPPVDEPPPSRRASADAKEGEIEAGVEEMIRRFAEVRTRQQHLIVVTEDGFQKRLVWLKRNRRELFDRLNAAIKECWARTDPARTQGELVP